MADECEPAENLSGEKTMKALKRILLKNWKVQMMVVFLMISVFLIRPRPDYKGVYVIQVSEPIIISESVEGVQKGDLIVNINGYNINNLADFYSAKSIINPGDVVRITVKRETFPYFFKEISTYPFIAESVRNETSIGVKVSEVPGTNLEFGLEIKGGTELLLKPEANLTEVDFVNTIDVLRERLNLFGLKEVPVRGITDLGGNKFIKVEFAGIGEEEAVDLISREGKFEAKIGNKTVFTGKDILGVCITGVQCTSTIQPFAASGEGGTNVIAWKFMFQIDISEKAASSFANITEELATGDCDTTGECYLNETIDFYIDDEKIKDSSLRISEELKGEEITTPVISGSRSNKADAQNEKRKLQAILQSRNLPVKLEIVRTNSISPVLGEAFASNIFLIFIICMLVVDILMFLRYRTLKIAIPIIIVALSEIVITLGVASLIHWTLDVASIAGLMAAVGTGVDDQIIITDEMLKKEGEEYSSGWARKLKKAFFIVMASFLVISVTMMPLLFAGAGILRGFALTTLIGLFVGVFITRPAYADMIKELLK